MISLLFLIFLEADLPYFINFKPVAAQGAKADLGKQVQRGGTILQPFQELSTHARTFPRHAHCE